jgi:hypothetical protein
MPNFARAKRIVESVFNLPFPTEILHASGLMMDNIVLVVVA